MRLSTVSCILNAVMTPIYPVARRTAFPFVSLFARRVDGVEQIPIGEPVIVAANHLGMFDPLFIGSLFIRRTKKRLRYLVDTRNLFWKTFGIALSHWTNTIPIRSGRREEAIADAVKALKLGDSIGMFPEGRVNTSPTLLEGRPGAVRMSLLSGKAILPVGIENTHVPLMSVIMHRVLNRPEGISIRFGERYHPQGDPDDVNAVRELTDELMRKIASLSQKPYLA